MGASLLSSTGCLSCLVVHPPRRHRRHLVGASSSIPHIVVVSHPPHCCHRHHPRAIRPVEASSLLLSGRGLIHSPHHRQPSPTSLLSLSLSVGHSSCGGLVLIIIWWWPCRHWELSSVPHIAVVVIVVHGPFVLQRPRRHHHCCQLSPTSLPLSLSAGHLSCGGLILVVIWWGPCCCWGSLSVPTSSSLSVGHFSCGGLVLIIVWWGSCCPSLTLSSSLSSACLVGASLSLPHIIVVVCRPLVLQSPCPSPTLSLLSSPGHLSCGGLIAIIIQWGPPPPCRSS